MNLNYSYRSFLITCLLFGIFFLALYSWKLGKGQEPFDPKYDIEYTESDPFLEEERQEEPLALSAMEQTKIETNRAYNEAEKFLEEGNNTDASQSFEEKLAQMDAAIAEGLTNNSDAEIQAARKKIKETQESSLKKQTSKKKTTKGSNPRTTISYSLKDRKARSLPNPVYTCEGGGKIVISIEVNAFGHILNATYNKGLSSTTNGCLIDSALEYANRARFTTRVGKKEQLGTITYNFPGQD